MKGTADMRTALVVTALAVAVVTAPLTAGAALVDPGPARAATADEATATAASAESNLSSGESLSGALSVHRADLEGSIDRRTLEGELVAVEGEEATAAVLAERRLDVERRLAALESRRNALRAERRNGSLSRSAYRVRAARLTAETRQLRRLLASIEQESRGLPGPLREAYGIDEDGLNRTLARTDAATEPSFESSFAAIVGEEPPDDPTTPHADSVRADTELAFSRTAATRDAYEALLEDLETRNADESVLECTRENVSAADEALGRAATGVERDESVTVEAALVDARTGLRRAHGCLADLDGNWTADDWDDYEWNGSDSDYEFDRERDGSGDGFDRDDSDATYDRDGYDRDGYEWNTTTDGSTSTFDGRDDG